VRVYIVYDPWYDGGLLGVFDSREQAQQIADFANIKLNHPKIAQKYEYEVVEREIGKYELIYLE